MPNCPDCNQALTLVAGSEYKCTNTNCKVLRVVYHPSSMPVSLGKADNMARVQYVSRAKSAPTSKP